MIAALFAKPLRASLSEVTLLQQKIIKLETNKYV